MIFPKERKLFSIKKMSQACGVSRATLIRMEECGFLSPYYVDPDTGYRYYDLQNVAAVGQYQKMQAIGLSRKEITDLYYKRVDSDTFIQEQMQKLNVLRRFLEEYEWVHDHSLSFSFSYVTLPAVTYYCEDIEARSLEEVGTLAFLAHERCVELGYQLLGAEPLMSLLRQTSAEKNKSGSSIGLTLCVPVAPESGSDMRLRFFPSTRALSIIGFGEISVVFELMERLETEVLERGIKPSGPIRVIALMAPYTGAHYKTEDHCYECVIPFEAEGQHG